MQHVAQGLASLGRGGDTMLVHMSPDEVHGLQTLAMAAGGSLSVNPDTGLPEAFKLKSLLPMIAGAVATFFSGGTLAPILAGAATGAATGDKNQSLLMRAGLGALGGWGGGGIASALAGAGTAAAGTTAVNKTLEEAAKGAATEATKGAATEVAKKAAFDAAQQAAIKQGAAEVGKQGFLASAKSAGTGIMNMFQPGGGALAGNTLQQIGMPKFAAAMTPLTMATPPTAKGSKEVVPEYQMTTYNPGKVNPKWGQPGEPYFVGQGYGPTTTTNQNPFSPTYASYDKKGKGVGTPGKSPLELVKEQAEQEAARQAAQQQGLAEGGSLSDYIGKVNASRPQPLQPIKAPVAQPVQEDPMSRMRDYSGAFAPLLNSLRGMNGFTGSGYGAPAPKYDQATGKFSYAEGGGIESLGAYSDGGRLLRGPGDGVSDDIPARIHRDDGTKQEARLADGEFVFPARIVSEIGNGSTEAGAQKLYAVMDKIQRDRARTIKNVALDTSADRHLQALV